MIGIKVPLSTALTKMFEQVFNILNSSIHGWSDSYNIFFEFVKRLNITEVYNCVDCLLDDDIRQEEGFKNVSLGNVLTAQYKESKITFLAEKDKVFLNRFSGIFTSADKSYLTYP